MTYHKAHPVPGIEADVKAGPYKLQWVDTPYGRIGAAICFDFNYPTFIRQAGKDGVDIMLQVCVSRKSSYASAFLDMGSPWKIPCSPKCCQSGRARVYHV